MNPIKQYCWQYPSGENTFDRLSYCQSVPTSDRKFSLGDNLESYDFSQSLNQSYSDLVADRLRQLKEKYSYTRLFFSGGKDSLLILEASLKNKIYFDEIVIFRHCPVGENVPIGQQVESDANAKGYLTDIGYDKSKITSINFGPEQYDSIYRDPSWIYHGSRHHIHSPWAQGYFFNFINREFNYLEDGPGVANIVGATHPHVYWEDGQWRFVFVDQQFDQHHNITTKNFLVDDDFPEILHAYVISLSHQFTKRNLRPEKFQTKISELQQDNQILRVVRDLVPEYQSLKVRRPDLELPKLFQDSWRPSEHDFWKFNDTYKTFVSCLMLYNQTPWQQFFSNYINNTDWAKLLDMKPQGGILSKEFSLG